MNRSSARRLWWGGLLLSVGVAGGAEKKPTIPPPEDVLLTTGDGVAMHCVYYAGIRGRETAPVMLVHGWNSNSAVWMRLASVLQTNGFAPLLLDLRGHGQSRTQQLPGRRPMELDRQRFKTEDIVAMAGFDLEAAKKFLLTKHNAGGLNIELLTVVGVDAGAVVAANWVAHDWSWPELPAFKQGQDVKGMVLISLPASFRGVNSRPALLNSHVAIRTRLGSLFIYGEHDTRSNKTSSQIYRALARHHNSGDDVRELVVPTDRGGTDLLEGASARLDSEITGFLLRQADKYRSRHAWEARPGPPAP